MGKKVENFLFIFFIFIFVTDCQNPTRKMIPESIGPKTEIVQEDNYSKILFISTNGSDRSGNGSKKLPWQTIPFALSQIQDANIANRYAIWVAEGTYKDTTISMKSFIDLYGGLDPSNWQRNIDRYRTILNGSEKQRVLVGADDTRLDGFVITSGVVRGRGGGIFCDGVSPIITNNIFTRNKTLTPVPWKPKLRHEIANDGGAIYVQNGGSPVIENNLFVDNETEVGRGAGIAFHSHCAGRIANNVFLYNRAGLTDPMRSSDGGAISVFEWSNPEIENNIILENKALTLNDGGGLFSGYWSSPVVKGNVIVGNYCGDDGGGIFTGGQNHHDEIPPMFDPIPNETDFFIRIADNVLIGNNEALEFTMESRGVFANNIVALNGGIKTHPAGVYFQRSEAHVVNNTIFDPFLMNYKTFDAKKTSEGLKPSTIKNNRIWGSFDLETDATMMDNFIMDAPAAHSNKPPEILNDWIQINADAVFYGNHINKQIFTTQLFVSAGKFGQTELVNRVVKAGNRWGVIKSNDAKTIEVWGDLTEEVTFLILPTYHLK